MELIEIMKQVALFHELNDEQLQQVAQISKREILSKGETLCRQGQPGDKMYIIGSGQLEIMVRDSKGRGYSAVFLGERQTVGEMSLIDQGIRSATVIAADDQTTVYSITADDFTSLCRQETPIGYLMMRNLALDLTFKLRHRDFDPSVT